ncbi:MAG TPA: DUF2189 domain-containing protein [Alphaproteobacteria bacterium]|jgi:uncharacterized membrane protein|nr:DUF2189 domain-containing protein [Alphaproteobacteria bacterium]
MATRNIRNPLEWSWDYVKGAAHGVGAASETIYHEPAAPVVVRRITVHDVIDSLRLGFRDFGLYRTDVMALCLIYPIAGIVLFRAISGGTEDFLPLLFPLASGFAIIGPVAAMGLYEMSRRADRGEVVTWATAFSVVRSPSLGAIFILTLIMLAIFGMWVVSAQWIYDATLGPLPPESLSQFAHDVLATRAGLDMILIGVGVGFLYAVLAFVVSVVSFPLLLDRNVGVGTAIGTSVRAVAANPGPMALWGLIVAAGLVLGTIPLFLGLIVALPVLGHATWHLYRATVSS